jgi:PAS domain S-box-containing protein/diguanylate cyclase (GGDEF)-like protein
MTIDNDVRQIKSVNRYILDQIVASISDGVLLLDATDPDLRIAYANPAYAELCGYSVSELVGQPWHLLRREEHSSPVIAELRQAIGRAESGEFTVLSANKDGSTSLSALQLSPLTDNRGNLKFFLCRLRPARSESKQKGNIEVDLLQRELGQARQRIASLSRTDAVTGLLNYRHFNALLTRDLAVAKREGRTIAVLLIEVVEIDVYRKTFGSNAADASLRMIGAQVAGAFRRAGDMCARRDDATIVVATRSLDEIQIDALAAQLADKVRGLGLHNPRARSGRYLTIRCASTHAVPGSDEAEMLVERCYSELVKRPAEVPQRHAQLVR